MAPDDVLHQGWQEKEYLRRMQQLQMKQAMTESANSLANQMYSGQMHSGQMYSGSTVAQYNYGRQSSVRMVKFWRLNKKVEMAEGELLNAVDMLRLKAAQWLES